jgi:hypothetical protein
MKSPFVVLRITILLTVICCPIIWGAENPATNVNSAELDSFMKKWARYESFKVPIDPTDEPLLLAALRKDPGGPWASYLAAKFAETIFEARGLGITERAAKYRAALGYLKPARKILLLAVKTEPANDKLAHLSNTIEQAVAKASLEAGVDLDEAKASAKAMLAGNTDVKSWNYGNIIYEANSILGRIALREDKLDEAKKHLLAAGQTPGSPQLNSFGPDFILAREFLEKNEKTTVLEFLDLVERFWANTEKSTEANAKRVAADNLKKLQAWREQIRAGKTPDDPKWK